MKRSHLLTQSAFVLGCVLGLALVDNPVGLAAEVTTTADAPATTASATPTGESVATSQASTSSTNEAVTTTVTTLVSETVTPAQPSEQAVDLVSIDQVNSPTTQLDPTVDKKVDNQLAITVISDIHVLPENMIADNEAFTVAVNSDRKLFEESQAAFLKSLELAEKNGSKALFITGDLTKDGEFESHTYVADQLKAFQARNPQVQIFLVPGNHDINNDAAINFNGGPNGGQAVPATKTSPAMFMDVYKDVLKGDQFQYYKDSAEFLAYLEGINQAIPRMQDHEYYAQGYNSYVKRMDMGSNLGQNGLTIIGLDTAQYSADTTKNGQDNVQDTDGQISEAQMTWLVRMAAEAHHRNDVVMVLAHHAFMPHFYKQETLLSPYIIKQWNLPFISDNPALNGKTPAEVLADAGIHYLFTGHMHAQDIAQNKSAAGNLLYDIETGSTVSTPSPLRHLLLTNQIDGKTSWYDLDIKSESVGAITYTDKDKQTLHVDGLANHGRHNLITPELVTGMINETLSSSVGQLSLSTLLGLISPDIASQASPSDALVYMLSGLLGDKANPIVKTVGPGQLTLYADDITKTPTPDLKIALDLKASLMGFTVDEPLMISHANASLLLADLMKQFDQDVLADQGQMYQWMNQLASKLLDYQMVVDSQGQAKTLSDLANFAYMGHLKGDETQPEWVTAAVTRLQTENVVADMLKSLAPDLADILLSVASKLDYQQGQDPLNPMLLLEFDKPTPGPWDDFVKGMVVSALGSNVAESLQNAGLNRDALANLISQKLVNMEAVQAKLLPLNALVANVLDGLTREAIPTYPNAFVEDNATRLTETLPLLELQAKWVTNADGQLNFVHDWPADRLKNSQYFVNGIEVPGSALKQLKTGDQVMVRVQYRNELGNLITYMTQVFQYQSPQHQIEELIEVTTPFETLVHDNAELAKGIVNILVPGRQGKQTIKRVQVVDANGQVISVTETILQEIEVVDQVIEKGTQVAKLPKPNQVKPLVPVADKKTKASINKATVLAELPKTGEKPSTILFGGAALAILTGLGMIALDRKEDKEVK
ncbi:metallophosphoesterase [Vaginisenegalia massiliensis]|uniref:metallophosphoesterase n=1 Tax=Vaginisenegalia massiliensis TaxID=2058294 RepID=UPI000F530341|nr:metallophosphoesterase [Vaginisenegalia massiliensis]